MLSSYIILFPLNLDNELTPVFENAIDPFLDWARLVENRVWIVCSEKKTSVEVRSVILSRLVDAGVETVPFLVFNVTKSGWASHKVNSGITEWLKKEK